jgi:hypothetical protein
MRGALAALGDRLAAGNRTERVVVDGVELFRKRRPAWAPLVVTGVAAPFLRLADAGIEMFASPRAWLAWEVHCATLLNGPGAARVEGGALLTRALPGASLRAHLRARDAAAFALGGAALRAAHDTRCSVCDAGWSHGDPHLGNIIVSPANGSGGVIDFETRHVRALDSAARHADDVATALLDLIGAADDERTLARLADAFLRGYRPGAAVRAALGERLAVRAGLPGVLQAMRSHRVPPARLAAGLERVRAITAAIPST